MAVGQTRFGRGSPPRLRRPASPARSWQVGLGGSNYRTVQREVRVKRVSGASFGDGRGHPDAAATHIGQLRAFVEGNEAVDFQPRDRDEAYGFVRETLERFGHRGLGKRDKGRSCGARSRCSTTRTSRASRRSRTATSTTSGPRRPTAPSAPRGRGRSRRPSPSAFARPPIRRAVRAMSASIRSTRATATASRASTWSTSATRSPSSSSWATWPASRNASCCPCPRACCCPSRSPSSASTPTTVASRQPPRRRAARQAARRTLHQVPHPARQRQRARRGQERQRGPPLVRPRPHPATLRARGQPLRPGVSCVRGCLWK